MIYAAGFGKRLQPLTLSVPKPLLEIQGKPVLRYVLESLPEVEQIVINTHYLAESVVDYLHKECRDFPVETVYEKQILGTGGGFVNACKRFAPGDTVIFNSDILFHPDWAKALRIMKEHESDAVLFCQQRNDRSVLLCDERGILKGLTERQQPEDNRNIMDYCGVGLFSAEMTEYFCQLPEGEESIITELLKASEKGLQTFCTDCTGQKWFDIGSLEVYNSLNRTRKHPLHNN